MSFEKLLLRYNCNLFKIKSLKNTSLISLSKEKKSAYYEIYSFNEKVVKFINSLPENILVYLPERKGFRRLASYLTQSGIRVKTEKIVPGSFTNPKTSYFMEEESILFLNDKYNKRTIKEYISVGGKAFSLSLPTDHPLNESICYNHRSVKSLIVFFFLFLVLRNKFKGNFKDYVTLLEKENMMFKSEKDSLKYIQIEYGKY